jgi:DNA-directed RNA polymerase specialized sigma24 family protein
MTGSEFDQQSFLAALDALPQVQRTVYLLASRDELSLADIGLRIGEDIAAVEYHLARALEALVHALDP